MQAQEPLFDVESVAGESSILIQNIEAKSGSVRAIQNRQPPTKSQATMYAAPNTAMEEESVQSSIKAFPKVDQSVKSHKKLHVSKATIQSQATICAAPEADLDQES